jgi:hypothetical protein
MSCRWPFALACTDFGIAFSTFIVLRTRHRCPRVAAKTWRSAVQNPGAPSPKTAIAKDRRERI